MSRSVGSESSDDLLRLVEVASPEKHGGGKDQSHTQIDRVIALGCHVDRPPRGFSGTIREADQPIAARQRDQPANLLIKAKVSDPRGARSLSVQQAAFAVTPSRHLVSNKVAGHAQCRLSLSDRAKRADRPSVCDDALSERKSAAEIADTGQEAIQTD